MINRLSQHPKAIALSLFSIFYAELAYSVTLYKERSDRRPSIVKYSPAAGSFFEAGPTAIKLPGDLAAPPSPVIHAAIDKAEEKADIGGPGQPEMSSFQSVNASNMVDLFTGDFSYNLPLLDVGGYPVNIHYSSGISMDQEASWVGLGWNVNPGTINRSMRGLPDDFNGTDNVTRTQNINPNKSVGVSVAGNLEVTGTPVDLTAKLGIFHNNYNGWGIENSLNVSINAGKNTKGPLTGSLAIGNNSQTGLDVSPSLGIRLGSEDSKLNGMATIGSNYNSRSGIAGLQLSTEVRQNKSNWPGVKSVMQNSYISFATPSYTPTITMPITNYQFAFTGKLGAEVFLNFTNIAITGYVSRQYIRSKDNIQKLPAYGYLYMSKATQPRVLLDFNREKDIAFNEKVSPHIAIPQYTYDAYNISGEGTGGMFRPYRGDVGYVYDHAIKTNSENGRVSGDVSVPSFLLKHGFDISYSNASTESGAWRNENDLLKNIGFSRSDSVFEEVYFRNPGEKTINTSSFYQQIGGDSLIRVNLTGDKDYVRAASSFTRFKQAKPDVSVNITAPLRKSQRDKRSQVISYLTAEDAAKYGLDKEIRSYPANVNPLLKCDSGVVKIAKVDATVRKPHHLSEINVLNADGRRYVYGLPVYNVEQQDVTFSVEKENDAADLDRGLASYTNNVQNNPEVVNPSGKDGYYTRDVISSYAHSFLLTGLLSPDYVDVKGDGITEDDLGDGVKFNYTQVYGSANGYYSWRTPGDASKANYNEGLKTYSRDDKGTYMFGRKEVWYTHSIESKTMIALFRTSDRSDAMSVVDQNGGNNAAKKLRKLDSVQLFVKADLIKNGTSARPIKTVHFEYSYDLCKEATGSGTGGKLTLTKIWFTYNGNNKGKLNPYLFYYNPDPANSNLPKDATNPSYNPKKYDRWGNYKDPANNPGSLNNIDYPYAEQDSAKAAMNATAWELTDIKLPSGGRMHIDYEGDDYGYVQNKRATKLFQIIGFGKNSSATPQNVLYTSPKVEDECHVVFVDASKSPVTSKADIYNKYLEGIDKIYFKLAVNMPADRWGSGYEFVPTYGEIDKYGTVAGNNNRFWIELKKVDGESPITKAAIQFLRLNLPSKAFPSSELGDGITLGGAVKMLASNFSEIKNSVVGFDRAARDRGWCKTTAADKSFIRLDAPDYNKYGGGLRVKRVQVFDNWKKMTNLKESVYGQEYSYKTSIDRNGKKQTISSGVASYEPMLGGEENVFHTPIEYIEKVAPLAPSNYTYTETPLGESYFPSAMVGYSKVRVRTINKKAKSANGWEETQFFTTKDFPTIAEFTPLDGNSKKRYNPGLRNFLRIDAKNYLTLSQGFKVELNDMNGKMKAQASYAENDSLNPITYTENFYKVDNDGAYQKRLNNTVWTVDSANGKINTNAEIGKEVEIMMDTRQQVSTSFSGSFSPNVDIVPTPIPFLPFLPVFRSLTIPQHEVNRFRSIAVMKVVQRYGILDSVVVIDKGSVVSTKNILYDGETGGVLLSRTNNEFNDPVYNFNYPAHWAYTGMGMAYQNINAIFTDRMIIDGKLLAPDQTASSIEKFFESGDEVIVTGIRRTSQSAPPNDNDCLQNNFDGPVHSPIKLWAVDAAKGNEKHRGIYFIDADGKPYSGKNVNMRILRSGKRNFTDVSVGGITSLANPMRLVSGQYRVVIDSNTRVINSTAAIFKDEWKVENSLYQADSCYTKIDTVTLSGLVPENSLLIRQFIKGSSSTDYSIYPSKVQLNTNYFTASLDVKSDCSAFNCNQTRTFKTRSIINYNLDTVPAAASLISATLNLDAFSVRDLWSGITVDDKKNSGPPDFSLKTNAHYVNGGSLGGRTNQSFLTPVFTPLSSITRFEDIVTGTTKIDLGTKSDNDCTDKSVSVTPMIREMLANPTRNNGIMIRLFDETRTPRQSESRIQSYCGKPGYNTFTKGISPTACETCTPPTLTIVYSIRKDTCVKVCRYNIKDTTNSYRWGILGNWRMDRAYTYYHERKESDASTAATNIRTEGELKSFIPYWQFNSVKLAAVEDTSKWVWNSAITKYNRKGFEIENVDPLGRYNSGLYGYNESMPVAVTQNSRYRETLFDGFEDYNYRSQYCDTACASPRPVDFLKGNSPATLQTTYSHSGRYSLAVTANSQAVLTVPVVSSFADSLMAYDSIHIDTVTKYNTVVAGKGKGLSGTYSCIGNTSTVSRVDGPINILFDTVAVLPSCSGFLPRYGAVWKGKVQPKYTDEYRFYINSTYSGAAIRLNDSLILPMSFGGGQAASGFIQLQAGVLYTIEINYPTFFRKGAAIGLSWSSLRYQGTEIIPKENLYPFDLTKSDTVGSLRKDVRAYCIKASNLMPKNVILPVFSPIMGTKLLVTAWVNTDPANCTGTAASPVPDGAITASFNVGSPGTTVNLLKTGIAIEGWQRYEAVVNVPATATQLSLTLKSSSAQATYFDDIRVHPFNSNMKSFVYDPVSLRLMAELDENNYATFYEYDNDGTLIRVKKETVRGIKTIKESRSALFKEE